jgi:selenium metabolism protein YedF
VRECVVTRASAKGARMAKTFLILSDRMGEGDETLGRLLMTNFLYSLARADERPERIMFANSGVRLACEGSESLEDLGLLAEAGVPISACGTCLDYLGLTAELAVGAVGTMGKAVATLAGDADVVTIA